MLSYSLLFRLVKYWSLVTNLPACFITGTLEKHWEISYLAFLLPHSVMNGECDFSGEWQDALPVSFILLRLVWKWQPSTFPDRLPSLHPECRHFLLLASEPYLGNFWVAVQMWLKETTVCIVIWPLKCLMFVVLSKQILTILVQEEAWICS